MWKIVANHLGGKYFEVGISKSLEEAKKTRELLEILTAMNGTLFIKELIKNMNNPNKLVNSKINYYICIECLTENN